MDDADALGGGAGEQPINPAARRGRRIHTRCLTGLGRGQQFDRDAVAGDADGRVEFGLNPIGRALSRRAADR